MELTEPRPSQAEGRDTRLLAAQLELLAGVVAGDALQHSLEELLRVVEQVSAHRLLASVLLLPGALLAGVMGMNFKVPLFEHTYLFWVVIGLIVGIALVTVVVAKLRRWI